MGKILLFATGDSMLEYGKQLKSEMDNPDSLAE
ncbi:hypothetical protein SAMN05446037_1003217 [Anaerovirgula multivorans]|uniref:Uncharacterized protein n=1 Tax=Anaerovirgula multivorans TaxID=312168 RepID=A0A239BF28_9FIRM|nr:hypothetical protein SAMN05446037_1003217 [Anaerovirgula multivorans]